jgi:hypothetical protein
VTRKATKSMAYGAETECSCGPVDEERPAQGRAQSLARYRQAWSPSGAKDDPTDAELALDVLLKHRDRLRPLRQGSAPMRSLRRLVEDRRRGNRVRLTNRLIGALKGYFPALTNLVRSPELSLAHFCNPPNAAGFRSQKQIQPRLGGKVAHSKTKKSLRYTSKFAKGAGPEYRSSITA